MPHQQPPTHQNLSTYSQNKRYTITDDLPSSSDDDDDVINHGHENGHEHGGGGGAEYNKPGIGSRRSGLIPGDSFPTTAHQLQATSMGDEIDDDQKLSTIKND